MSDIKLGSNMEKGRLELILGPMFSGKSTRVIEISNRYESIGKNVLNITHIIDNRYGNGVISSHNKIQKKAICTEKLMDLIRSENYIKSEIILVEEGQFFADLIDFVKLSVDVDKKHVIVAGLNGDYKRERFGSILDLIPMCENVELLTAFCKKCNDGTLAHFTKRIIVDKDAQTLVGSDDIYIPVCRFHYTQK
jgi:thymidine kinase